MRAQYHQGQIRTPARDHSIHLWLNSKGPFHTIRDAPRVCRPGAVMLMLVPDGGVPAGSQAVGWRSLLPEPFRTQFGIPPIDPNWAYQSIIQRLAEVGLRLTSW